MEENRKKKRLIVLLVERFAWLPKFLGFFDIGITPEEKYPIHFHYRFLALLGVLVFLVLLGMFGMYEYSVSPSFCNSCHIMKPYYDAWKTSKHNKVACVECHYPPGVSIGEKMWLKFQAMSQVAKYVTRTYSSKPYAEVSDTACLRLGCHEGRLLEGKVVTKKGVSFDHKPHLETPLKGRKLACVSCHSQIAVGTHIEVTTTTCFLCHFKGKMKEGRHGEFVGSCKTCHTPSAEDIKLANGSTFNHKPYVIDKDVPCEACHLDATEGSGEARIERCFDCHNEPERLESYDETEALHEIHVNDKKIECTRCHDVIRHKVRASTEPLEYDCSYCHEKRHSAQKLVYMGTGGRGVNDMPSAMYLTQVDCAGCHTVQKEHGETAVLKGQTYEPTKKACLACHDESYMEIFNMWKSDLEGQLARTKELLGTAEAVWASLSKGKKTDELSKLLEDARYNCHLVEYGHGIHNPDYAGALLTKSQEMLKKVIGVTAAVTTSPALSQ